jgi:molecular chaperone GrpE
MTNEEQRSNGEEVPREDGSEETASDPQSQEEPLTVDDILSEDQTEAARAADVDAEDDSADEDADADAEAELASEAENPYLEDLRRLTAEYANYRRRTEDNAEVERQRATAKVIMPMLDVLDDLDRAEEHGDLAEGSAFATIAQKVRNILTKQGLESFGEKGDTFDPQHHEAIAQVPAPGAEDGEVLDVVEKGYRLGNVELRPAKVAVAVNADG